MAVAIRELGRTQGDGGAALGPPARWIVDRSESSMPAQLRGAFMESRRVRGRCCASEPAAHGHMPVWIQTPRRLDSPECQRAWRGGARASSTVHPAVCQQETCARVRTCGRAERGGRRGRNEKPPRTTTCGMGQAPCGQADASAGRRTRRPPPARFRNAAHDHRRTDAPKAAANLASRSHQRPKAPQTARAEGTVNDGSRRAARAGGGSQPAARRPQEASRGHAAVSG